jgi:hypothetical protein
MSSRMIIATLAGVLAAPFVAGSAAAEPMVAPAAAKDPTLVRELMPPKQKGASRCFEARVSSAPIDVEDWSNWRHVPIGGMTRDGQPQTVAVAAVKPRKLARILVKIVYEADAPDDGYRRYSLWTAMSITGWKKLYSGASCSYQTERLAFQNGDFVKNAAGEYVSEPVTPQISCGVDCDGGGISLFYAEGEKPTLKFLFHDGGMRMSGNCSVANYTVGGEHEPDGQVKKSENASGYLLSEVPAKLCRGLERRAIDAMSKAGE